MVTVEELEIPRELDDSIAARDFLACAEVRNAVDTLGFGSADFAYPAEEELPGWLDQVYTRRRSNFAELLIGSEGILGHAPPPPREFETPKRGNDSKAKFCLL